MNTVAENKSKYSVADYSRAVVARKLLKCIGRPSSKTFLDIIKRKKLQNCPVTYDDVLASEHIWGPEIGTLKGKTVRHAAGRVRADMLPIPAVIMNRYQKITLSCDIMKVNKIPFFVSISHGIKFGTVELLTNQKMDTITRAIKNIQGLYRKRGFIIEFMLMDGEFEPLRGVLAEMGITMNTTSREEHVPVAERRIRTLKERVRGIYNTLPFTKLPVQMVVQMVYFSNFWLNVFPPTEGVSQDYSPRELITGVAIDYLKHCTLEYGAYAQVHEEHNNSMAARTVGAIAMRPTGNVQGGYWFYSLNTGRMLNRNNWTELPMPADVIQRVHAIAKGTIHGLLFTDRRDDEYDENYLPGPDDNDDDCELDNTFEGVEDEEIDALTEDNVVAIKQEPIEDDEVTITAESIDEPEGELMMEETIDIPVPTNEINEETAAVEVPQVRLSDRGSNPSNAQRIGDLQLPPAAIRKSYINNKAPEIMKGRTRHQTRNANINVVSARVPDLRSELKSRQAPGVLCPKEQHTDHEDLEATVMTQLNMKQGIKTFGRAGVDAVQSELKQLHDREVMQPIHADELSHEQKKASLQYLMFLKQKRCGKIKGRGCADGRKQRATTKKEDASSPTVSIESVMLSCTIDAMEGRDVATVDIPGAFMQADVEDTVHMKLEGTMAELLVRLDPKLYRKYVKTEHGKSVLYVELLKALYGTLKAALLFWKLLSSKLVEWGFEINPYDWCVANKMVDGKQCTILWHVDDLKISHVDSDVVTKIISTINQEFGKEAPITVKRGKVHDYLGMTLDYSMKGKVMVKMLDYVENMLRDAPEDMRGESATPAGSHLFQVNEDATKLDEEKAQVFHHIVAKSLFLCKRARPDVQTPVAFLCTRVKQPDEDDYKKLKRMIQYLRLTRNLFLTLEADNLSVVKWWVDASYAVHADMRSHTGATMSLGKGAIYGTSTKQKLNSKSSTEAELIGVSDVMSQILWTMYFMEAQGYPLEDNVVYQDNQSAMLLEKNGRGSSSKRTRHINIRYFFVTDRIKEGEMRVEYCPTGDMVADYFTKPLQGSLFRKMRDTIMNVSASGGPASMQLPVPRSVLDVKEPDGTSERTYASVVSGKAKRKVNWENLA